MSPVHRACKAISRGYLSFGYNKERYGYAETHAGGDLCRNKFKEKMKIVITGSLGNISRPLAAALIEKGHSVTVISSRSERREEIQAMGASAAIGSLENKDFLTGVFRGADSAYCMIPPGNHLDAGFDIYGYYDRVAASYHAAVTASGIRHIVHLSSIGADMESGNGFIAEHHKAELKLDSLPASVAIATLRPAAFYNNLFAFIPMIRATGAIRSNYGGGDVCPWVSPLDIARAAAEEIEAQSGDRKIRYVASEERSCDDIAAFLGAGIGKPELGWKLISDAEMQQALQATGMNPAIARGFVEMNASIHSGRLMEDYFRHTPRLGPTKFQDFRPAFAAAYRA